MADELAPFLIPGESLQDASGTSIGSGSYGAVSIIRMNGLPCVGKRLHAILISRRIRSVEDREAIHKRFRDECILLSRLRHPNIVQFLGVHYGRDRYDLTLVMERMHMDLETALEKYSSMSLPTKLRILLDASYGLLHLHRQDPPIIHRDFTAGNILLSPNMRAKVADLGVSKILDSNLHRQSSDTLCPGAQYYMSPEALKQKPVYDVKLDVFSFGHLALYTVNQQFPEVFELGPEGYEALRKGTAQLAKRMPAIDMMGRDHCLHQLVTSCLLDSPKKRPTTAQVNSTLQDLVAQYPVKDPHATTGHETQSGCGFGSRDEEIQIKSRESEISAENEALRSEIDMIRAQALGYRKDYEEIVSSTKQLIKSEKVKWTAKIRREMKREKESLENKLHRTNVQFGQCKKLLETLASQNDTRAGNYGSSIPPRRGNHRLHSDSEVFSHSESHIASSSATSATEEVSQQRPHSIADHELSMLSLNMYQILIEEESSSDEEGKNMASGSDHWLDTEKLPDASDRRKTSPAKLVMSQHSGRQPHRDHSNEQTLPPPPHPRTLFIFPDSHSPIPNPVPGPPSLEWS